MKVFFLFIPFSSLQVSSLPICVRVYVCACLCVCVRLQTFLLTLSHTIILFQFIYFLVNIQYFFKLLFTCLLIYYLSVLPEGRSPTGLGTLGTVPGTE